MQMAADERPGTMAALIGIGDDDAEAACQRAEDEVWVANYNAPGQVVIAGTATGVATATERAKELGARKVLPIPVSGAFHTQLMLPARGRLRRTLEKVEFHSPEVPVMANVDARVHTDPGDWPGLLSAQLCSPVRWRQSLEALGGRGATVIAELGPGGVLTGMVRRTIPDVRGVAVAVPADLDKLMDTVAGTDDWTASGPAHQGEHLYTSERVIVSPTPGVFEPDVHLAALESTELAEATAAPGSGQGADPGSVLAVGDRVGTVGLSDVRTPFDGILVRWLAVRGERVVEGQPVAWIRTPASPS
jgi:[acyl-carrier-protein] S-malonyltransferase